MTLEIRCLFFVAVFLLLSGCSNSEFSSPELERHFTDSQIEDLNKVNDFFISEFLKSNSNNFKEAFLSFKHDLIFKGKFSENDELLYQKQRELYNSISKSTFEEIWTVSVTEGLPYPDEEYMDGSVNGKYFLFLQDLSKTNNFAKACYVRIERTGDFNGLFLDSYFHTNRDTFDYDDFHNQLILAIYYLTAIDEFERD